jgi:hypothetical protein
MRVFHGRVENQLSLQNKYATQRLYLYTCNEYEELGNVYLPCLAQLFLFQRQ